MPLTETRSKATVLKALRWLSEQPHNWSDHIKDSNIAVKMYLKSQGRQREAESGFAQELKGFLGERGEKAPEPAGAFLAKKDISPFAPDGKDISPPARRRFDLPAEKSLSAADETAAGPRLSESAAMIKGGDQKAFCLDKKSETALEMARQKLNVESEEEALRLLIQLGKNSLEKIFSPRG